MTELLLVVFWFVMWYNAETGAISTELAHSAVFVFAMVVIIRCIKSLGRR